MNGNGKSKSRLAAAIAGLVAIGGVSAYAAYEVVVKKKSVADAFMLSQLQIVPPSAKPMVKLGATSLATGQSAPLTISGFDAGHAVSIFAEASSYGNFIYVGDIRVGMLGTGLISFTAGRDPLATVANPDVITIYALEDFSGAKASQSSIPSPLPSSTKSATTTFNSTGPQA